MLYVKALAPPFYKRTKNKKIQIFSEQNGNGDFFYL